MYGDTDNVVQVTIWDILYLLGCLNSTHTQQAVVTVKLLTCIYDSGLNLGYISESDLQFLCFSSVLPVNVITVPRLGHNHSLSIPVRFTIHCPTSIPFCIFHSKLLILM